MKEAKKKRKKIEIMANFIDVSNLTYAGKEAQEIFSKSVYALDLRGYGIQFMDGVKGKTKIYSGEIGDAWQAYTCPFTPSGSAVLAEAFIEPVAIKVNQENCYDTFWNTFLVDQTSISLNGGIPQTFADWYFNKLQTKMAKEYQEIFWAGSTGYTGTTQVYKKVTNGVEAQLEANSGTSKISGSAFTVDNILAQVEATISSGIAKAAESDVATDNYKVFMNYSDVKLLKMALGKICCPNNQSIFSNYAKEGEKVFIFGYEVVPTMQTRNGIIFGPANNLVLGFDTFDSHIEYKLIDMRETTGDNMFRVLAISNIAVGIVFPELFIYSRPE